MLICTAGLGNKRLPKILCSRLLTSSARWKSKASTLLGQTSLRKLLPKIRTRRMVFFYWGRFLWFLMFFLLLLYAVLTTFQRSYRATWPGDPHAPTHSPRPVFDPPFDTILARNRPIFSVNRPRSKLCWLQVENRVKRVSKSGRGKWVAFEGACHQVQVALQLHRKLQGLAPGATSLTQTSGEQKVNEDLLGWSIMCWLSWFSGPGCWWCPTSRASCRSLRVCPWRPGLAFAFMALRAEAWSCQLPYHPCKNGMHSTRF